MKGIRLRFIFWILGLVALYLLANVRLRIFPHILLIFWLLLPVLSIIFSLISRRKLSLEIYVDPSAIERGERGTWLCNLTNDSQFMSFFLQFPNLQIADGKSFRTVEIMLQPGERRELRLDFTTSYTGEYELDAEEPIYEDLLGFFWLDFSKQFKAIVSTLHSLPREDDQIFTEDQENYLSDYRNPVDRKSLNAVTDEVYSIDPIRQGQSLTHAHWKLSARLQEWMIKSYSEREMMPLRVIVDCVSYNPAPKVEFYGMRREIVKMDNHQGLLLRNRILDSCNVFLQDALSADLEIELCDRSSNVLGNFHGIVDQMGASIRLASIPFDLPKKSWHLDSTEERKQVIFVQEIDEETLGSLIRFREYGIKYLLISFKKSIAAGMDKQLQDNNITCMWIDEE